MLTISFCPSYTCLLASLFKNKKLQKRNKEINSILKSKAKLNKLIIHELDVLSEEYAHDRRTNILHNTDSSKQIIQEIKIFS